MKRFSPKQTLSNFATRVRETVEFMNTKNVTSRTTMLMLAVATFAGAFVVATTEVLAQTGSASSKPNAINDLFSAFSARDSNADRDERRKAVRDACKKDPKTGRTIDKADCLAAGGTVDDEQIDRQCERIEKDIEDATEKAVKSCQSAKLGGNDFSKCLSKVVSCAAEDSEDFDEEDSEDSCDIALANRCPALPQFNVDRDYREEYKDAESERKDLKKDLDSLLDEQKDAQKELARKQREMAENQQNEAFAQREQERKIKEQLDEALESIGKAQKKGFENAQAQYEELELQVLALQTEAANANINVAAIESQLQSKCRSSAERKYQEAEKARLAALASTGKKKNVGQSTAVAGSSKRARAATTRARTADFNAFLSECTSGASAEGMNLLNEIAQAKAKKKVDDGVAAKKAEMLEKRRASVAQKLMAMEEEADGEAKKVIKKVNDEMTALNEKRNLVAQQNQARMIEFQQEQAASKQALDQKIQYTNGELNKTIQKAALAERRRSCLGRNANRSEATREKINDGYESASPNLLGITRDCDRRTKLKFCGADEPRACVEARAAFATSTKGRSSRPTGSGSSGGRTTD